VCGTPGRFFCWRRTFFSIVFSKIFILAATTQSSSARLPVFPALRILLCTALIINALLTLDAQHQFRHADSFGKEIGLGEGVLCMAEDNEGLFWVGTQNGLFRFDGSHAREILYKADENVGFETVSDLDYETGTNTLWICSERGVCCYDLSAKTIKCFDPEDYFPKRDVDKGNKCIFQDRQGEWWGDFNTTGLTHFLPDEKKAERFVVAELQLHNRAIHARANTVMAVIQDVRYDSIIWAGTRDGLIRANKADKTVRYFQYEHPNAPLREASNAMICLVSHANGRLYIGTWNGGLLEFDPNSEQFQQFLPNPKGFNRYENTNQVYSIIADGAGALWIGSSYQGICRFDLSKRNFIEIKKGGVLNYKDKKGNYWGIQNSLIRYDRLKNQLPVIQLPFGEVKKFKSEAAGKDIYVKKNGQPGVFAFDPGERKTRAFPFPGNTKPTTDGAVLEFGKIGLLANDMEQLYLLPKGEQNFVALNFAAPSDAGWLGSRALPDGGIVISGMRGYLFHFKPGERVPEIYPPDVVSKGEEKSKGNFWVSAVDYRGRAWLRSNDGYTIFDPRNEQFYHFSYKDSPSKIFPDIRDFWPDGQGRMWCNGPEELGWIDQSHPENGIQQRYDASTGFDFKKLEGPRVDQSGRVWISTDKGLVRLHPESGACDIFPINPRAKNILPDGRMVVSFDDGVSVFHPDSLCTDTTAPRPYATWFKVLDKEKPLHGKLLSPNEIRLTASENFISIGFSALGFFRPSDYQFAYQLVGVNDDWVNADADNLVAAYTALDGGDYIFRLKVRDATGRWSERPYELRIHIATPWYRTWPAWLLYAGLTALIVRWWLRNRDRQLLYSKNFGKSSGKRNG